MESPTLIRKFSLFLGTFAMATVMSTSAFAQHSGGGGGGHAGGGGAHFSGGGHVGAYGGYRGGGYAGYGGYRGGYGCMEATDMAVGAVAGAAGGWGWGWGGLGLGLYFATLPLYYQTYWWNGVPYYYADNTYYIYDPNAKQYQNRRSSRRTAVAGRSDRRCTGDRQRADRVPEERPVGRSAVEGQIRVPQVGGRSDGLRSDDRGCCAGSQASGLHARPSGLPGRPRYSVE